jgi:hypothetical protein
MMVERVSQSILNIISCIFISFREHSSAKFAVATFEQMLRIRIQSILTFIEIANKIILIKCNTEIYGILYVIMSGFLVNDLYRIL